MVNPHRPSAFSIIRRPPLATPTLPLADCIQPSPPLSQADRPRTTRWLRVRGGRVTAAQLRIAVDTLAQGGIVVLPTDTVYGLAADALNRKAVSRLAQVKGRTAKQPVAILLGSAKEMKTWGKIFPTVKRLSETFLPGPFTLVVPTTFQTPRHLVQNGQIGLRVPKSRLAQKLVVCLGRPLAATSANRMGQPPCRTGREAYRVFRGAVDLVLDAGVKSGPASTVVQVVKGKLRVIREGPVSIRTLQQAGFRVGQP